MGNRMEIPKVNAGSMADIAFLLLIFFLVTTTIEMDTGIDRMLPQLNDTPPIGKVKEKNILRVQINDEGQLLIEGELSKLGDLKKEAINFLDNGGFTKGHPDYCGYCKGQRSPESSDSPTKAIISITNSRETSYGAYISAQNELAGAYNALRNREAQRLYKKDYTALEEAYQDSRIPLGMKKDLKKKIKHIQELFPLKISEAETK